MLYLRKGLILMKVKKKNFVYRVFGYDEFEINYLI